MQYEKTSAWLSGGVVQHLRLATITLCTIVIYYLASIMIYTWAALACAHMCATLYKYRDRNSVEQVYDKSVFTQINAVKERGRTRHDGNEAHCNQNGKPAGLTDTSEATRTFGDGATKDDDDGMTIGTKSIIPRGEHVSGPKSVHLSSITPLHSSVVDWIPSKPPRDVCDLDSQTGVMDSARDPSGTGVHYTAGVSDEFVSVVSIIQLETIAPIQDVSCNTDENDEEVSFVVMSDPKDTQHCERSVFTLRPQTFNR